VTPRQPRDGLVAVQVLIPALHDAGGDEETLGSCCRIALLGFGTVGSAVARRLISDPRDFTLTHVLDRGADRKRGSLPAARVVWTTCVDDVLQSDADIVIEAIGGVEPAAGWIRAALLAGKSVVTANKQVMARHGPSLLTLAARQGRQLRFEAAVGGAMPIVRAIADGLAGDRITRIVAILNGTTNAVLSSMDATGCSLHDAVRDARAHGFAESDPSADLDGDDAAAKLAILCALAFGLRVDPSQIETRSAAEITPHDLVRARVDGGTIRQIARAEYDRDTSTLTAWVAPIAVPRDSIFAATTGARNAAIVTGVHSGDTGLSGTGAGGDATAVAVISDLAAIARDRSAIVPAPVLSSPGVILGFTTMNAELAEHASFDRLRMSAHGELVEPSGFSGLCVDRRPYAEAV
jgi:homoserine dehydrogenase